MADPETSPAPLEQIELIGPNLWPERPDLVELVKGRSFLGRGKRWRRYVYSGKITFAALRNDSERCEAICMCLAVGLSARMIARRFGLATRTVALIREAMTERGELAPVRNRVMRLLDEVVERGLERVRDAIDADELSPAQLPIQLCAFIDKKGQLESGVVPGTSVTQGDALESQVRVAWLALKRAQAAALHGDPSRLATESPSIDIAAQPLALPPSTDTLLAPDTSLDTPQRGAHQPEQGPERAAHQAPAAPAAAAELPPRSPRKAGGGVAPPPGAAPIVPSPSENFQRKESSPDGSPS